VGVVHSVLIPSVKKSSKTTLVEKSTSYQDYAKTVRTRPLGKLSNEMKCEKCKADTIITVQVGIHCPSEMYGNLTKSNLRKKEVWLTHANWETTNFICENGHTTFGYGNFVTRMEKALKKAFNLKCDVINCSHHSGKANDNYCSTHKEIFAILESLEGKLKK